MSLVTRHPNHFLKVLPIYIKQRYKSSNKFLVFVKFHNQWRATSWGGLVYGTAQTTHSCPKYTLPRFYQYSYIISPCLLGLKLSFHFAEGGGNTATAAGHLVVVGVVLGGDGLDVLRTELSHPLHQRVLHFIVGFKPVHLVLEDANLVYCLGNGPEKEMLLSLKMSTSIISFAKRQNKISYEQDNESVNRKLTHYKTLLLKK